MVAQVEQNLAQEDFSFFQFVSGAFKKINITRVWTRRRQTTLELKPIAIVVKQAAPVVDLRSTARIKHHLFTLTAPRPYSSVLDPIDEEVSQDERAMTRFPEFSLNPKLQRRAIFKNDFEDAEDGMFFVQLLRQAPSPRPTVTISPPRLQPSPRGVQRGLTHSNQEITLISQLLRFAHLMAMLDLMKGNSEGFELLQMTADLALSLAVAQFLEEHNLLPRPEQQTVRALNRIDGFFPRSRARTTPPNAQQFFAPNYYRPAPRPVLAVPSNDRRLSAVDFPQDLVPEEATCAIMSTVMDNPVRLPETGQVCDGASVLKALQRKPENPFNRQPMKPEDATPDLVLKGKIGRYVDAVVAGVREKQSTSGQAKLSRSDYEAVNQVAMAMSGLKPQVQPQSSPAPKMGR